MTATARAESTLHDLDSIVAAAQLIIKEHGRIGLQYSRISDDPEGREMGVIAQAEDTTHLAEREGVALLPRPFEDNDLSASTLAKKPRPDYELMRKVIHALPRNSTYLYCYSNSRLTRRPVELEDWIKTYEATGVLIKTVVSGSDDLSTADGRMVARIKADVDAAEAEKTSERVTRRIRQLRENGVAGPGGGRAFGWTRAAGGLPVTVIEREAQAIQQGASILLTGGTTGDVLRAWTEAGVKPVRAGHWSRRTITGIYNSPRVAGLYLWDNELRVATNVPAILDRETWESVCARLVPHDLSREPDYWTLSNLLSGVLQCGRCGHSMSAKGPHYGCLSARGGCGGVFRKRAFVDELVVEAMESYFESLPAQEAPAPVTAVRQEIERLEKVITDTLAQVREGLLTTQDGLPFVAQTRKEIKALAIQQAHEVQTAAAALSPETAFEQWNSDDVRRKRRAVATLIRMVVIFPLGRGYGRHAPLPESSVEVVWW